MTTPQPNALLARLAAPTDRLNARASWLSVLAALIWPAQAAVVAIAIAGLLGPAGALLSPLMAAVAFFALHLLRTLLEAAAQKAAQAAAIALVGTVRERLIATALLQRIDSDALPSAELAALVAEKAALLDRMDADRDRRRRRAAFDRLHTINAALSDAHHVLIDRAARERRDAEAGLANTALSARRDWCFALYPEAKLSTLRDAVIQTVGGFKSTG